MSRPGVAEAAPIVFEEPLVNALVHRDSMDSAAIRVFVFDDRVEVVSPVPCPTT